MYALINEAWGQAPIDKPKHDVTCPLVLSEYNDDIMSTYINTDPGLSGNRKQQEFKKRPERHLKMNQKPEDKRNKQPVVTSENYCFDADNLVGYMGSSRELIENAYPFENFFLDNNVRDSENHEDDICEEELPKEHLYKTVSVLEEFNGIQPPSLLSSSSSSNTTSTITSKERLQQQQFDMILYIVSGVLLIFMMDQILQLGRIMCKR